MSSGSVTGDEYFSRHIPIESEEGFYFLDICSICHERVEEDYWLTSRIEDFKGVYRKEHFSCAVNEFARILKEE